MATRPPAVEPALNAFAPISRGLNGASHDLGHIGAYATAPTLAPFSAPTVVATSAGFEAAWLETVTTSGSTSYQFRHVALAADGSAPQRASFGSSLAIHYTDVAPRLFATPSGTVLVYKGRTADALPQTRLVFEPIGPAGMPTAGGHTAMTGEPAAVCWDGSAFAQVAAAAASLTITRVLADGSSVGAPLAVASPAATSGALRIAPSAHGWFVLDGTTLFHVASDGGVSAASTAVSSSASLATQGDEAIALGPGTTVTAWRVDAGGRQVARVALDATNWLAASNDAATWTGTQWVVGFADIAGTDDEARWTTLCN